jgi:peptide/nickel transport system permease protein
MGKWIIRRLLLFVFVLWGITTVVFIVLNAIPRNPAIAMAGSYATQEQIEKFNARWGLDRPILERYVQFYSKLFRGDLGLSIRTERPVTQEILRYLPATFELATFSILLSIVFGVVLGTLSAIKRGKLVDQFSRFLALVGVSTPNFWLCTILLIVFYGKLGWVGPGRVSSPSLAPQAITKLYLIDSLLTLNWASFADSLKHILLPAVSLGLFGMGIITRMMRSSMLEVINKDYVLLARAKGLSYAAAIRRHAVKNALLPVVTVIGVLYGVYLAGAIVIEVVFAWPGVGYFAYRSILKADQPAVLGFVVFIATIYSAVNLVVDFIYRLLDPRISF